MLRADDEGLIAHTLNYDHDVGSAADALSDLPDIKIKKDMLDLARHIVSTKAGTFDPSSFDDRYEEAVAALEESNELGGGPVTYRRCRTLAIAGSVVNFGDSSICQGSALANITPTVVVMGRSEIACLNPRQNGFGVSKILINRKYVFVQ